MMGVEPQSVVVALAAAAFGTAFMAGCGGSTETVTVVRTETETTTLTVTDTVPETAAEREELDTRNRKLDAREAGLDAREKGVKRREKAVARAERVIRRSRFGDGTYLVGKDIPAGSYVAPGGGGDCYWERTTKGGSIIDNSFGPGQARAYVNAGELFSTQGCGTWRRG